MTYVSQILTFLSEWVNKYFPLYINWLTLKLQGQSSFGLLSVGIFLAVFFALIFVFVRRAKEFQGEFVQLISNLKSIVNVKWFSGKYAGPPFPLAAKYNSNFLLVGKRKLQRKPTALRRPQPLAACDTSRAKKNLRFAIFFGSKESGKKKLLPRLVLSKFSDCLLKFPKRQAPKREEIF